MTKRLIPRTFILTLACLASNAWAQTVLITEFMAENDNGIVDEHGHYSDWIEIFNNGPGSVDLTGWSLTDNPENPAKWVFPVGTTLAEGAYLLVWASGEFGGTNVLTQIHTSFTLSNNQDYLGLYRSSGTVAHEYNPYRVQFRDTSYGIGAGIVSPYYATTPTPGAANAVLHTPPPGFNPASPIIGGDLAVKITEIMYHPRPLHPTEITAGYTPEDFEYIELHNDLGHSIDLSDMEITEGVRFDFTNAVPSVIHPGEYKLVVANRTAFEARYGLNNPVIGQFAGTFRLANSGDTIAIRRTSDGTPLYLVEYNDGGAWPNKADGVGASIVAIDPDAIADPMNPDHYRSSPEWWGSPGVDSIPPMKDIVINEVNSHSDIGEDWIELYNRGQDSVNVGGWYITDVNNPTNYNDRLKYQIPDPTVILEGGYLRINQTDLGFGLFEGGDDVVVTIGDVFGPRAFGPEVDFGTADQNVTFGRYQRPDGKTDFTLLAIPTPEAVNAPPMLGPVTIVEIFYNQPGPDIREYVVIKNITSEAVELFDRGNNGTPRNPWRMRGGAKFDLPLGVTLPANSFAILSQTNEAAFRATYPAVPTTIPVIGPWSNKLDNSGGEVKMQRPANPESDGSVNYITVDQVDYNDKAPWPTSPDGGGDALVRVNAAAYGKDVGSWKAGSLFSSLVVPSQYDSEPDGLPDAWEFAHFGSPSVTTGGGNVDGDPMTELEEFLTGTNPIDANDYFRIGIEQLGGRNQLEVPTLLAGGAGSEQRIRLYTIEYTDDLLATPVVWTVLGPYADLPGLGTPIRYNAPPQVTRRVYQVRVRLE